LKLKSYVETLVAHIGVNYIVTVFISQEGTFLYV